MAKINLNRLKLREKRRLLHFERKYAPVIYRALQDSVKPVLVSHSNDIDDSVMYDALVKLYEDVGYDFAKANERFMKSIQNKQDRFFLDSWAEWIRNYANVVLADKVKEINETTRNRIKQVLADALEQGIYARSEISKLIERATLGEIGKNRSRLIARTESASAGNEGKERSAREWSEESGERLYKLWIAGGSKEPRQTHLDVDDDIAIPIEAQWNVGGEMMDRPHDPNASAENVINCSCVVVYVNESYNDY